MKRFHSNRKRNLASNNHRLDKNVGRVYDDNITNLFIFESDTKV